MLTIGQCSKYLNLLYLSSPMSIGTAFERLIYMNSMNFDKQVCRTIDSTRKNKL